jgi:phosphatidylglycerophosphate synthase
VSLASELDASRAEKKVKTLFGWLFFRRISLPLSLLVARTPVRPWQITTLGLAAGLTGAGFLATGAYHLGIVGGILAMVAKLLDAMDGEVARAKGMDSRAGYVADGLVDRVRDTAVIVGLGVGAYRHGSPTALMWTLGAVIGYLLFFYVSAAFPAHWREIRSEADLDEKHMFRVGGRLRLGAGDTLAVATFAGAVGDVPLWPVIAIACAIVNAESTVMILPFLRTRSAATVDGAAGVCATADEPEVMDEPEAAAAVAAPVRNPRRVLLVMTSASIATWQIRRQD